MTEQRPPKIKPPKVDYKMENFHCNPDSHDRTSTSHLSGSIAIVVGRFQSDTVCYAMDSFIRRLEYTNKKVILLVGLAPVLATKENPLDFEARKLMLMNAYPRTEVGYIKDHKNDEFWTESLDEHVKKLKRKYKAEHVTLYGGTTTFIDKYSGEFPTKEIPMEKYINEKMERQKIKSSVKESADFRRGVIWAVENQYPKVYPTVDMIIFADDSRKKIVLGRKPAETKFRFPGGFVDTGENLEEAAIRESKEETGLDVEILKTLGSRVVKDWRYQGTDNILTNIFLCGIVGGRFEPGDDIVELKIVDPFEFQIQDLVPEHQPYLVHVRTEILNYNK